jgi:putative transposase
MPISFVANVLILHLDEVGVTTKAKGRNIICSERWTRQGTCWMFLLQRQRDKKAAARYPRKLLKQQGFVPRVIVANKLKSYKAAKKQLMKWVYH